MRWRNPVVLSILALAWITAATATDDETVELDEEAILQQLQRFDPPLYQELMRIRADSADPGSDAQYRTRLRRAAGRLKIRDEHPAWAAAEQRLVEVEVAVDAKVAEYHAATTDEQRQALHAELLELAGQVHDLRLDSYRFRIALLQMRLRDLEDTVKAREEDREGFIESWLQRKLGAEPRGE